MEAQSPQTAKSHEEPFAVQFSVFLANRVGAMRDLLEFMKLKELHLLGLSVVDSIDWAVIRMVLSDPDKAREMLKGRDLPFTESRVLLACLEEETSLSTVCLLLMGAELNLHFAYPLMIRHDECPVMVLHVDDEVVATHVLTSHGFTLLGEEDLQDPR